jgi:hypothetical protein
VPRVIVELSCSVVILGILVLGVVVNFVAHLVRLPGIAVICAADIGIPFLAICLVAFNLFLVVEMTVAASPTLWHIWCQSWSVIIGQDSELIVEVGSARLRLKAPIHFSESSIIARSCKLE